MKVKELIEQLEQLDPEMEVWSERNEEVGYPSKVKVQNPSKGDVPYTKSGWVPDFMKNEEDVDFALIRDW